MMKETFELEYFYTETGEENELIVDYIIGTYNADFLIYGIGIIIFLLAIGIWKK